MQIFCGLPQVYKVGATFSEVFKLTPVREQTFVLDTDVDHRQFSFNKGNGAMLKFRTAKRFSLYAANLFEF